MVRWLAERSKTGKESLYSLGVGEAEKLRNEIRELQENHGTGSKGTQDGQGIERAIYHNGLIPIQIKRYQGISKFSYKESRWARLCCCKCLTGAG